jgi:hypothetical protein
LVFDGNNLGLNVTPSAWYTPLSTRALEFSAGSLFNINNTDFGLIQNGFLNSGGSYVYKASLAACRQDLYNGGFRWYTAPSGTAGNPITFTQAMTLTAAGRLGIGTTSPTSVLDVRGTIPIVRIEPDVSTQAASLQVMNDSKLSYFGRENSTGDYFFSAAVTPYSTVINAYNSTAPIIFGHNTAEVYIANGGNVGIGTSSPDVKLSVVGDLKLTGSSPTYPVITMIDSTASGSAYAILSGFPALGDFTIREAGVGNHLTIKKTSGNAVFAGNIGIGGTTPTTSGTGITFPASQSASSDPQTLDDYEEGTWTPTLTGSSVSGSQTYTTQLGSYTKIGRLVSLNFYCVLASKGTISGNIYLSNFPFTSAPNNNDVRYGRGSFGFENLATIFCSMGSVHDVNVTYAYITGARAAAFSSTALTDADLNNTSQFHGSLVYNAY